MGVLLFGDYLVFLRLKVLPRMVAAPVREIRHRADHRPRWDSSAVRGLVEDEEKTMLYSFGVLTGLTL
jgi:hypothetical protein